jgi:hypothetical protein
LAPLLLFRFHSFHPFFQLIFSFYSFILKESIDELKDQLLRHPSILPVDFDISPSTGQLLLNVPPEPNHVMQPNSDSYEPSSDPEQSYEFDCRPEVVVPKLEFNNAIEAKRFHVESTQQEPDYVNISAQVLYFYFNFH